MATIKEVAQMAGVGVGTVSRYINGDKGIKDKNKALIENAINVLDYQVNPIARSMKTQRTMTIGVVVHSLTNMFSMKVIESLENTVEEQGYSIIVSGCSSNEELQYKKLKELKKRRVDGIIILPVGRSSRRVKEIVGDTPCIVLDRLLDKNVFDSVSVNNFAMVYDKMKKVIELGYKKIGIIEGPDNISNAVDRKNGFYAALKDSGIKCRFSVTADYSLQGGYKGMRQAIESGCDCVFASNKEQAIGALKAVCEDGEGSKLYTVCFDDIELPWSLNKPFSCIPQPIEAIGKAAGELLLKRILNPDMEIESIVIDNT